MNNCIIKKNIKGNYNLIYEGLTFKCQIGTKGIIDFKKKIEGDKCTPRGSWNVKKIYYRPDRVNLLKIKNMDFWVIQAITKNCGWCDDYQSKKYNKYINL